MIMGSENVIKDNFNSWFAKGHQFVQSKDGFVDNQEVAHGNFDSAYADFLSNEIKNEISHTFKRVKTKKYLFRNEDFFKAVEKLNLNQNHVIVAFGIYFEHYIQFAHVKNLSAEKFNTTKIYNFPNNFEHANSIFILKHSDLPQLIPHDINKDEQKKYDSKKISEPLNLYTSIIDFNKTTEEILNENSKTVDKSQLIKSVLITIHLSMEIRWKKSLKVIQFSEYSEFNQDGLPNNIKEIRDFKEI
jgi:hypothetical protein